MSRQSTGLRDPDSHQMAVRVAVQVAFELVLFFVPVLMSAFALLLLNLFFRHQVRLMSGAPRWILLLSIIAVTMAASSFFVTLAARRFLPPVDYTLWTSAIFSLMIFLMALLRCMASSILTLHTVIISAFAGALFFIFVGLPAIAAKSHIAKKSSCLE